MAYRRDRLGRMAAWLNRRRWIPVVSLVIAGLLVAALEQGRPEVIRRRQLPLRELLEAVLVPLRRAGTAVGSAFSGGGGLREENERLRRELARARADLQLTREEMRRLARVSGLRNWHSPDEIEFLPADVIGVSTDNGAALLVINRGRRDRLREGMPVVGPDGLAGVIIEVTSGAATVQTPADPASAVGVVDAESRRRGVIFGQGRGRPLRYLPEDEDAPLEPGAVFLTSGLEGSVYPRGLVVGRLLNPDTDDRGVLHGAVRAAQDVFALEEVLVVRPAEPGMDGESEALGRYVVEMTGEGAGDSEDESRRGMESSPTPTPTPAAGRGGFPAFSEIRRERMPLVPGVTPAPESGRPDPETQP